MEKDVFECQSDDNVADSGYQQPASGIIPFDARGQTIGYLK